MAHWARDVRGRALVRTYYGLFVGKLSEVGPGSDSLCLHPGKIVRSTSRFGQFNTVFCKFVRAQNAWRPNLVEAGLFDRHEAALHLKKANGELPFAFTLFNF
ncbi:hypothetical protein DT065_07255 [Salicibibacter kimchii]|uniref:Uncharacterized protein n=1 Tax=Salicibibacter kimchii TaxID=2099786 RepID=A0A345BY14_9BACI|nr:hypothetical protein DT065_07255 [Salicibibacter kimchii]